MKKHANHLFHELLEQAIDCTTIAKFTHYASISTNWAERQMLLLLEPQSIYRLGDRLLVNKFDRLCVIYLKPVVDELDAVCMDLPFSVKHLCGGLYRPRDIKRIDDYFMLHQLMSDLAKFD